MAQVAQISKENCLRWAGFEPAVQVYPVRWFIKQNLKTAVTPYSHCSYEYTLFFQSGNTSKTEED
jgi:hypothetical protein